MAQRYTLLVRGYGSAVASSTARACDPVTVLEAPLRVQRAIWPALVALFLSGIVVAGCGGDDEADSASGETATSAEDGRMPVETSERTATAAPAGSTVKIVSSRFGRVLADRRGQALYLFDKEQSKRSECYGPCAKAWPPLLTRGRPRATSGARRALLGTTRRRDGKLQVTYAGHPVYYYEDDSPGRILCQNVEEFGGLWLLVKPDGGRVS